MSLYVTLLLTPLEQIIGFAFEILGSNVSKTRNEVETEFCEPRVIPQDLKQAFNTLTKCLNRDGFNPIEIVEDEALYDRFSNIDDLYQEFIAMLFEHQNFMISNKLSTKLFDNAWRFIIKYK